MALTIGHEDRLEVEPVQRHDGVAAVIRVSLIQGPELSAIVNNIYLIPEAREAYGLVEFLESLSSLHWTGWSGTKEWSSLEHNLTINAAWRHTGGTTLRVILRAEGQYWEARGTIELDNMALERIGPESRLVLLGIGS